MHIIEPDTVIRPRIVSPDIPGTLPLLDEINEIDSSQKGLIAIIGPVGSGKSIALKFLEEHLADDCRLYVDDPDRDLSSRIATLEVTSRVQTIYAARVPLKTKHLHVFELAPWSTDEHIEYLLAKDRLNCARVMQRLREIDTTVLRGNPELSRVLLDAILAGADGTPETIFRRRFDAIPPQTRELLLKWCFASTLPYASQSQLIGNTARAELRLQFTAIQNLLAHDAGCGFTATELRLLEHPFIQRLLATDFAQQRLLEKHFACFAIRWPHELLAAVSAKIARDASAHNVLTESMLQPELNTQPMLASLLIRTDPTWIPKPEHGRCYEGAILDRAQWPGATLSLANFIEASLNQINLDNADLHQSSFYQSKLRAATLRGASLKWATFDRANLTTADLSAADAELATFANTNLAYARLQGTNLAYTRFFDADLNHADLSNARLGRANLFGAKCNNTDFTGADFTMAQLDGLDLSSAKLDGANFQDAHLPQTNLEYIHLSDAQMPGVDFTEALLTGSILPRANLRGANLGMAGLAEIEWEYADLRGANFAGVSFHFGSTRTGLVNSTIACEGSKTGFYTDDYEEQSFKAPETIRKASLRGADLRGAHLQEADFYLVDLRDAQIDSSDIPHLRRCGAILKQKKYGPNI